MANTIKLKRASGSDPGNSDLSTGELAIRTSNCKLFSKNDSGSAVGIVAGSADTLTTARTIAGVSFDGSANISLNNNAITNGAGYITATLTNEQVQDIVGGMVTGNTETGISVTYQDGDGTLDFVVGTLNQDTTGNAATATALETARNIGGVSFDGTGNINLPGVNTSGNQDTSGNAATATALASARTIAGVSFDGTGNISLNNNAITNGAGYITDLVNDTSPQLGGNLLHNGNDIIGANNEKHKFGNSAELVIYSDGTNSYLLSDLLFIKNEANNETIAKFVADGAVELYHDNTKRLETNGSGINVTGNIQLNDSYKLNLGNSQDLQIYHDGSNSYIQDTGTGQLVITSNEFRLNSADNSQQMIGVQDGGSVDLYHNGSQKLQTTSSGVSVSGDVLPNANNSRDLGSSSLRWANLFVNDMHFANSSDNRNKVDGTWGDWTLQEGEDTIYMLNNRNGKKYKMNLTEV